MFGAAAGCILVPAGTSTGDVAARQPLPTLVLPSPVVLPGPGEAEVATHEQLAEGWQGASRSADLTSVDADLVLDLEAGKLHGTVRNTFTALRPATSEVVLGDLELEVREVFGSAGNALAFRRRGPRLVVTLDAPLAVGDVGEVTVRFAARPIAGYVSTVDAGEAGQYAPEAFGAGEPAGLAAWLPTFDDPSELAVVQIRARVRDGMAVVSNGVLQEVVEGAAKESAATVARGERTFVWRTPVPIPLGTVALAAARLETFAASGSGTELYFHLPEGASVEAAQRTFGESSAVLEFMRRRLGRPFPYPRFDQVMLRALQGPELDGATLTLVDASELATAEDELDDRRERPRRAVARGIARKWFGGWIAPFEPQHRWLLDGLAYLLELDYEARVRGDAEVALEWELLRGLIVRRVRDDLDGEGLRVATTRLDAAERAGWVMRMVRGRLGDETFWSLVRAFAAGDAPRLVSTEDFRRLAIEHAGVDLGPMIAQWGERRAVPELEIRFQRREVDGVGESVGIVVDQVQPGPLFRLELPYVVHFEDGSSESAVLVLDRPRSLAIVPLERRLVDIGIDPDGTLLAGLDIVKDDASWIAQGAPSRSAVERMRAIPELARLARTEDAARQVLVRLLLGSPEPTLREFCAQYMTFKAPSSRLALERSLAEDPSPWVRRAAAHALINAFADGRWEPTADDLTRLSELRRREPSPAAVAELERLITLVEASL